MIIGNRYFPNARIAAIQYQYEAGLRFENSRQIDRFGATRCAVMQREAAELYALARKAAAQHDARA